MRLIIYNHSQNVDFHENTLEYWSNWNKWQQTAEHVRTWLNVSGNEERQGKASRIFGKLSKIKLIKTQSSGKRQNVVTISNEVVVSETIINIPGVPILNESVMSEYIDIIQDPQIVVSETDILRSTWENAIGRIVVKNKTIKSLHYKLRRRNSTIKWMNIIGNLKKSVT